MATATPPRRFKNMILASCIAAAGAGVVQATTFAPNTDPDYIESTLREIYGQHYERMTTRFSSTNALPFDRFKNAQPYDAMGEQYRPNSTGIGGFYISWSYAPDTLEIEIPGFEATPEPPGLPTSSLYQTLNGQIGTQSVWQQVVADAFDRWQEVSGVTFQFIGNGERVSDQPNADSGAAWDIGADSVTQGPAAGDIRIAMIPLDGPSQADGRSGTLLAFTYGNQADNSGQANDPFKDPMGMPPLQHNIGYRGNIILDSFEFWGDPSTQQVLEVVMMREIGFALGMAPACPINNEPEQYALLEWQMRIAADSPIPLPDPFDPLATPVGKCVDPMGVCTDELTFAECRVPLEGGDPANEWFQEEYCVPRGACITPLGDCTVEEEADCLALDPENRWLESQFCTEAFPPLLLTEPQDDDIRASHWLYGDRFDGVQSGNQTYAVATRLGAPSYPFTFDLDNLSLSWFGQINAQFEGVPGAAEDLDRFRIYVPDEIGPFLLDIEVEPIGGEYPDQLFNGGCIGDIALTDSRLQQDIAVELAVFDPITNEVVPFQIINDVPEGQTERTFPAITLEPGIYYITVFGARVVDPTSVFPPVQRYDLSINITPEPEVASGFAEVVQSLGVDAFRNDGFFGESVNYATVEAGHAWPSHVAFAGNEPQSFFWSGDNPTVNVIRNHPTGVTGAAAGQPYEPSGFEGVARPNAVLTGSVATQFFPGGSFNSSPEGVYYAVFGPTDPDLASTEFNLTEPISVINESWGQSNGDQAGVGFQVRARDAAAVMRGVTLVVAAGNEGQTDNTTDCDGAGGNIPGGPFLGGHTVGAPATAFNVISVGAAGSGARDLVFEEALPYTLVADFSSRGPIDSFDYDDQTVSAGVRPGIHIIAPGTGDVFEQPVPADGEECDYPGHGSRVGLPLPALTEAMNPAAFNFTEGTSFAAPIVAGSVALLQDAGNQSGHSVHPLVMRAILMNSATKQPGWSNNGFPAQPQDNRDGRATDGDDADEDVITPNTAQALDFAQGAGLLNLTNAHAQYLLGTTDVPMTDPNVPTLTGNGVTIAAANGERGERFGKPIFRTSNPKRQQTPKVMSIPEIIESLTTAELLSPEKPIARPWADRDDPDLGGEGGLFGPPSGPGAGDPGPRPPFVGGGVPPGGGNPPGGGDPEDEPSVLVLFCAIEGLANELDPNGPIEGSPVIGANPLVETTSLDATRIYLWAQMTGDDTEQRWNQISFDLIGNGTLEITGAQMLNYTAGTYVRWSTVSQGVISEDGQQLLGVNLVAGTNGQGVNSSQNAQNVDVQYDAGTNATLLGFIEVEGDGELFYRIGEGGIAGNGASSANSLVRLGFETDEVEEDEFAGNAIGEMSELAEATATFTMVINGSIPIGILGWDHANVDQLLQNAGGGGGTARDGFIDYVFDEPIFGGEQVAVTLVWHRTLTVEEPDFTENSPTIDVLTSLELEDLDLEIYQADEFGEIAVGSQPLATSTTTLNNIEHIYFTAPFTGSYVIRVQWQGTEYDLLDTERDGEVEYALAWAVFNEDPDDPDDDFGPQRTLNRNIRLPEPQPLTLDDLNTVLTSFGKSASQDGYVGRADLNRDGQVDLTDLNQALSRFGNPQITTSRPMKSGSLSRR